MLLEKHLEKFDAENGISKAKGKLSAMLVLTRKFAGATFPVSMANHVTNSKGQVKGLGGSAVKKILREHGIMQILASEGGRTNRGNLGYMEKYVECTNALHAAKLWDAQKVEAWWIGRVHCFLDAKPFRMRVDLSKSVRSGLRDLFAQIQKRQTDAGGLKFVGAVYQHLVGAKLEIILGKPITHHAHSTADAQTGRAGDFIIDKTAIHVTTAPGEALIYKCRENLDAGLHPIIVTTSRGCITGEDLAREDADRIEFIDIEQFLTANIHEWGKFDAANRRTSLERLIAGYNAIVTAQERTPGLTIEMQ